MRKLGFILPLLAGFAATPAYAQDLGVTFRAEARAAYDQVRGDITFQNSTFTENFGVADVAFGGEAGVDARFAETFIVGAYGGVDFSKADECKDNPFSRRTTTRRDVVCLDAGRNLYAGGRVGFAIDDTGVLYVKGGLSRGKFDGSYTVTTAAAGQRTGVIFDGKDTVGGYHFGGGFEVNFTPSVYVKGEYVQTKYKNAFTNLLNLDTANPNPLSRTDRFDPSRHQLVVGIGFRFGGAR